MARPMLLLVRPTIRTIRWSTILGGAVAAQFVLWAARGELSREPEIQVVPLRVAAVLLCLGMTFVLDDDAGATVEPVAVSLMVRRGLRVLVATPVIATAWGAALWAASRLAASGSHVWVVAPRPLPVAALTLEASALLAVTLAAGAVGTRSLGHGKGGVAAGPALLAFVMATASIQRYWPLFPSDASEPGWAAAHVRWGLILVVGVLVLAWFSFDPARRSRTPRGRNRPRTQRLVGTSIGAPAGRKP